MYVYQFQLRVICRYIKKCSEVRWTYRCVADYRIPMHDFPRVALVSQ